MEKILDLIPARLFDFGVGEGWRADAVRSKGLRDALPDHLLISHEVAGASCPLHLRRLLERAKLCRKRVIGSFGFTGRSMPAPRLHAGHRNFESRPRRNEDRGVEHPVLLEASQNLALDEENRNRRGAPCLEHRDSALGPDLGDFRGARLLGLGAQFVFDRQPIMKDRNQREASHRSGRTQAYPRWRSNSQSTAYLIDRSVSCHLTLPNPARRFRSQSIANML